MDMKELLKRVGDRPTEIAYRLGVTEQTVRNWSRGVKIPNIPINQVPAMLEALDCSLEELVSAVNETAQKRAERLARGGADDD
jgi:hypothetical protein